MNAAISVSNLRKTYPRSWASPPFEALKGISLSIEAGETFGFIGPNGAGKSTTIKILTGVMSPSEGTASLFGVDVSDPESRRGLGYVPENPSLPDYLTPYEILSMGLKLHRRRPAGARAHCMAWLERFGLADVANKVVRGFSKGMAQRTALAHAMAVEPRLLILDEPTEGIQPNVVREIGRVIRRLNQEQIDRTREQAAIVREIGMAVQRLNQEQGMTVLLVEQKLPFARWVAHRFCIVDKGRAVATGAIADLNDDLVRQYLTV